MMTNPNPLRKHFRQPAIYIRLPSQGRYYPQGALSMPPNGELAVLPMTAMDEITSRTPDALFNGSAVVELIRSCVPNIVDPWSVPATDFNTLLVAMRLASYGHEMDINTTCPKCGHEHRFGLDLRVVLDTLQSADYETPLQMGDLTFYFAPPNYKSMNDISRAQFDDQKITQALSQTDVPEDQKLKQLGDAFRRITELTMTSVTHSIVTVKTADAMVTDQGHIREFLANCPKHIFEQIKEHVIRLRSTSDFKPLQITCSNCANQYTQEFTLDMSNFFAINS